MDGPGSAEPVRSARRTIGAHRVVHRLARRTGLPVGRADVDVLCERGQLAPTGKYEGHPVYAQDAVDSVDVGILTTIVAEREAWLAGSVDGRTAAARLGWRDDEFAEVVTRRAMTAGRFGRYSTAEITVLAADRPLNDEITTRRQPAGWARQMLEPGIAVILDTETTELNGPICEIAVIDAATGTTLLDTLVNPRLPITTAATAVHGISDADVDQAPAWPDVLPALLQATKGRQVLAYSSDYDRDAVLVDSARYHLNTAHLSDARNWTCLMAQRVRGSRAVRLPLQGARHRALDDCRAALVLLRSIALTGRQ